MYLVKTALLLLLSQSAFANILCSDILQASNNNLTTQEGDTSGFINPFSITPEARIEQENANTTTSSFPLIATRTRRSAPDHLTEYFQDDSHKGLRDFDQWKRDFLDDNSLAKQSLDFVAKLGRHFNRKEFLPIGYIRFFAQLNNFTLEELTSLTPQKRILILKAFSRWNLLPSQIFTATVFKSLENDIKEWSESDFLEFGIVRKISPIQPTDEFIKVFKKELLRRIPSFELKTLLSSLTGELYQRTPFSLEQMDHLLINALHTLSNSELNKSEKGSIAALKDLYRGLLYLKTDEHQSYKRLIQFLQNAIEEKLNIFKLSLGNNAKTEEQIAREEKDKKRTRNNETEASKILTLIRNLVTSIYGEQISNTEESKPHTPGFFDAVDEVYYGIRLVVEIDGLQHYFKVINENGELQDDLSSLRLRPIDQLKDASLRSSRKPFNVLRINKFSVDILNEDNFLQLLQEQNKN